MYKLSRLDIIGELDYDCPRCILEDIVASVGLGSGGKYSNDKYLYRHNLLIMARKIQPIVIERAGHLRRAATYINPSCRFEWSRESISKCIRSLERYHGGNVLDLIPPDFDVGYQDPNRVDRINIAIVYRACLELGIKMSYSTGPDTLIDSLRLYKNGISNLGGVLDKLTLKESTMRSIIAMICELEDSKMIDPERVKRRALEDNVKTSIHPKIGVGESLFNKFDPTLPEDHYSTQCLEYYRDKYEVEGGFEEIRRVLGEPTWHKFNPSLAEGRETPLYRTELSSHSRRDLYQYGVSGESMKTYSEESLIAYFESSLNFNHPILQTPMSECSIERLESISSSKLRSAIHLVRSYLSASSDKQQEFIRLYMEYEEKDIIVEVLRDIHDLGMTMRGWDMISKELPISRSEPDNQFDVDCYVTSAMTKLDKSLEKIGGMRSIILNLPTLRMTKGFLQVGNPSEPGFTIGDRISLIKSGNQDDINTCIRINSNWIVASSYVYLNSISKGPSYSLEDLREIS